MDRITMEDHPEGTAPPAGAARDRAPRTARPGHGNLREDWLETKLKGLYDDVASEPLPDALRQLIEQLDG